MGTLPPGIATSVSQLSLRSWPCGEACRLFCFCQRPSPGAPASVPGPLIWDEHSPRRWRAREVRSATASPCPHPGRSKLAWFLPSCRMMSHWREIHSASPSLGWGKELAGTLEWGEGRREQDLNPQAPMQVCLCPRRAAVRVHFGVFIMEPLQHFLTNQSQAHQEGLVVKMAPLLSKRVL